MTDPPAPPEAEAIAVHESLAEHLELAHYITVFNASAARVRYVVFVMVILAGVILVTQWNTTSGSWISKRYDHLTALSREVSSMPTTKADHEVADATGDRVRTRDELSSVIEEYRHERVTRVMLSELPWLGATFDVNDLGLVSGIAFILLLILLVFSLMREYDNLHLAAFKVCRLHDKADRRSDGESTANFLYHALAMGQVFSSPPTLAHWKSRALKRVTHYGVFLIPVFVHGYVVLTNFRSLPVALAYGEATTVMLPQYMMFIAIVGLCGIVLLYEEAANKRWIYAFLYINPAHERITPFSLRKWLKRPINSTANRLREGLLEQAVERLTLAAEPTPIFIDVEHPITLRDASVKEDEMLRMARRLEELATESARQRYQCSQFRFVSVEVLSSTLQENLWEVRARWTVHCDHSSIQPQQR